MIVRFTKHSFEVYVSVFAKKLETAAVDASPTRLVASIVLTV